MDWQGRRRVLRRRDPIGRPRLRFELVGMPELDAALGAGHLRAEVRVALSPRGLGAKPIELEADEEIIARVPEAFVTDDGRTLDGETILIAKHAVLPRLKLTADDPRLAELARVLTRGMGPS
jgi:hypothetical protein